MIKNKKGLAPGIIILIILILILAFSFNWFRPANIVMELDSQTYRQREVTREHDGVIYEVSHQIQSSIYPTHNCLDGDYIRFHESSDKILYPEEFELQRGKWFKAHYSKFIVFVTPLNGRGQAQKQLLNAETECKIEKVLDRGKKPYLVQIECKTKAGISCISCPVTKCNTQVSSQTIQFKALKEGIEEPEEEIPKPKEPKPVEPEEKSFIEKLSEFFTNLINSIINILK